MITLGILKRLEDNGLGTIDENLFWEKLTLDKVGVYITSIGNNRTRGQRRVQSFTIYSRGANDVSGYKKLKQIINFLNSSYEACTLPAVPPIYTEPIQNVTIMPLGTIENAGLDSHDRIVWSVTGEIIY